MAKNNQQTTKKCRRCDNPLKNDLYGDRCEDCFADGQSFLPMSYPVSDSDFPDLKSVSQGRGKGKR